MNNNYNNVNTFSEESAINKENSESNKFIKPDCEFCYVPNDYAYAKCEKIENGVYAFKCIDHYSQFSLTKKLAEETLGLTIQKGDYLWAKLQNNFSYGTDRKWCHYKVYVQKEGNLLKEAEQFYNHYGNTNGKIIYAPIKEKNDKEITVSLGPQYYAKIPISSFGDLYNKLKVGNIVKLKVDKVEKNEVAEKTYYNAQLTPVLYDKRKDEIIWDNLPKSLSDTAISENIFNFINGDKTLKSEFLNNEVENKTNLVEKLEGIYREEYLNKRITVRKNSNCYSFDFDTQLKDENGVPVHVGFKKSKDKQKWEWNFIGPSGADREFEKYVYIQSWNKLYNDLCEKSKMLKNERWSIEGNDCEYFILKQYLKVTFYKARLDGQIFENEKEGTAIFNTGLVDDYYDDLYCFLSKNENEEDFYNRKWSYGGFYTGLTSEKNINKMFSKKPSKPQYIKSGDDVFFDTTKKINCDYEHILEDNSNRLPNKFIRKALNNVEGFEDFCKQKNIRNEQNILKEYLEQYPEQKKNAFRLVKEQLEIAVNNAKKRCEWNYKTAIPIYYPRNNSISLLLPLFLKDYKDYKKPDAALVIQKFTDDKKNISYQGQTILTLDMAYQDARLICRPDSDWLSPSNINFDNSNKEDIDSDD